MDGFNDIGISRQLDMPRVKKLLSVGLFASVLHFAGDMILGWGVEDESLTGIPRMLSAYYRITRCPICAYAEKLGVSELMPLFCELDEVMIALQHGVLHRAQTLASGGAYCDYFITGDKETL